MRKVILNDEEVFSFAKFIVMLSKLKDRVENANKDELLAYITILQEQVFDLWDSFDKE